MPNSPSKFFAALTQEQKELVLKDAAEELAQLFIWYTEAMEEAVAMKSLTGQALLKAFQERKPEIWARLQSFDPKEHAKQLADWQRLETRDLRRPSEASPLSSNRFVRMSANESQAMPSIQGLI